MSDLENIIKKHLIENSFEELTKDDNWKFFKNSNYYKFLQNEPARFFQENILRYAQKFLDDMQNLNLIDPSCYK